MPGLYTMSLNAHNLNLANNNTLNIMVTAENGKYLIKNEEINATSYACENQNNIKLNFYSPAMLDNIQIQVTAVHWTGEFQVGNISLSYISPTISG